MSEPAQDIDFIMPISIGVDTDVAGYDSVGLENRKESHEEILIDPVTEIIELLNVLRRQR